MPLFPTFPFSSHIHSIPPYFASGSSLQFIAVLPTTNDQVVYGSGNVDELRLVQGVQVLSPLSRKINYSSSRYVSLISFMIFACILTEGWSSCF
jgi:hypothetical protein